MLALDWEAIPLLSDIIKAIIIYSPRVVQAIIVLFLGWVIGRLVSYLIYRIMGKMRVEGVFRRISVGRAILRAGYTPSIFFAALGKGYVYLLALLSALNLLSIPLLTALVQTFTEYIPYLVEGVLILVVGFICVDWIGEAINKGVISPTFQSRVLAVLVKTLLYFMTLTIALVEMQIDVTILYIFAHALAWSLAIAIGIVLGWNLKDKIGTWFEKIMTREE